MNKRQRILIVDDDEDFVEATKIALESKSYEVVTAYDSEDGFRKLSEQNPDLLILDVLMEGKATGFIFSRKMRKDPAFDNIPILMLTGMREKTGFFFADAVEFNPFLPVDRFLEKPIEMTDLLANVEHLLKKPLAKTPPIRSLRRRWERAMQARLRSKQEG